MRGGEEGKKSCPSSYGGSGQTDDNSSSQLSESSTRPMVVWDSSQLSQKAQPGLAGVAARVIAFVAMAFKPSSISFFSLHSSLLPPHHVSLHPPLIA